MQFETIHPFLDGNGRVGRLLIALQLCCELTGRMRGRVFSHARYIAILNEDMEPLAS